MKKLEEIATFERTAFHVFRFVFLICFSFRCLIIFSCGILIIILFICHFAVHLVRAFFICHFGFQKTMLVHHFLCICRFVFT